MSRNIYQYTDGPEEVRVDPLQVFKRLRYPDLDADVKLVSANVPEPPDKLKADMEAAQDRLLGATLKAFGLKPYQYQDGKEEGWTINETFALLEHFSQYIAGLRERHL